MREVDRVRVGGAGLARGVEDVLVVGPDVSTDTGDSWHSSCESGELSYKVASDVSTDTGDQ